MPPLTKADFDALVAAFDAATTAVGTRIQKYIDIIAGGGLSPEEEQKVFDAIKVQTDRLIALGSDPAVPVPPDVEPAPVPGETPGTGEQP